MPNKHTPNEFESELIDYIFNYIDEDDDYISVEILCRKLYKYGLIDKENGYYMPRFEDLDGKQREQTDEPCFYATDFGKGTITKYTDEQTDCAWK